MEDFVTRAEHQEFEKRIESENERQNRRLTELEATVKEIADLTVSVKELAVNMKHMATEQEKQGTRLESIEARDGNKWRDIIKYIFTAIAGAIVAYIATKMGLGA